jgi:hypothetical protein
MDVHVTFMELESEGRPEFAGWYWTEEPIGPKGPDGIRDVGNIKGPFETKQDAIDDHERDGKRRMIQ